MPVGYLSNGMGWIRDFPDIRDFTTKDPRVKKLLKKAGLDKITDASVTSSEDLREWCSPIENQGRIGSCTANAGVALVEYLERRATGKHIDASRLFLYKTTRNLLHWTGDTGGFLRSAMGAMVLFGVPPEEYWPYDEAKFDEEPPAFCYAFAQSYQAIKYVRLDRPGRRKSDLLRRIKANITAGLPSMFGFTVYNSISQAGRNKGKIPYPARTDKRTGGHAVVAIGYDDNMEIKNRARGTEATTGALMIRNSWGTRWGDEGYGWLPYEYVLNGLAVDWWTLLSNEWLDTGEFKR
jgi:C1A family cysteine protease